MPQGSVIQKQVHSRKALPLAHERPQGQAHPEGCHHRSAIRAMRQYLGRPAVFAVAAFLAAPAGTEEPVELHPCAAYARPGRMDENGAVTRPDTARQIADGMARHCDYAVLGRFVSITDSHYDEPHGSQLPVVSTFQVSEVLRGEAVAAATIRLKRSLLVAPGKDVTLYQISMESSEDERRRYELATETERLLASIRDSGQPLTGSQHDSLVDALKRLAEVPPRTRYERHQVAAARTFTLLLPAYPIDTIDEQHEMAGAGTLTSSTLNFYTELGAIRPDELYLLGLDDKDTSDAHDYLHHLHTYLFWGREALDIAAALREKQE